MSKLVYISDGKGNLYFDEEEALAVLLKEGVLGANSRDYLFDGEKCGHTVVLFVICSDLFAWGTADAENIAFDEIEDLYRAWFKNEKWGPAKWCCKKRNEKPQKPVADNMKRDGVWDEFMDNLPENHYDKVVRN